MNGTIFVNLAVADVAAARAFYTALGFGVEEAFSDENAVCLVLTPNIYVMALKESFFDSFLIGTQRTDARTGTEVLNCLGASSREEVEDLTARVGTAGGAVLKEPAENMGMYGSTFADPDGHVWELLYMPAPEQ